VVLRPEAGIETRLLLLTVPNVVLPPVPLDVNVTDPVGPSPPLCVSMVAVNVTLVVVVGVAVFAVTNVAV